MARFSVPGEPYQSCSSKPLTCDDLDIESTHSSYFICAGTTQKGLRCRNRIAAHNEVEGKRILAKVSHQFGPEDASNLHMVATYLLCTRFHQDQAPELAKKWLDRLSRECAMASPAKSVPSWKTEVDRAEPRRIECRRAELEPVEPGRVEPGRVELDHQQTRRSKVHEPQPQSKDTVSKILPIEDHHTDYRTCIGTTKTGSQCGNRIAEKNAMLAVQMSQQLPISRAFDDVNHLENIAGKLLCVRDHQYQAGLVAQKWLSCLKETTQRENPVTPRRQAPKFPPGLPIKAPYQTPEPTPVSRKAKDRREDCPNTIEAPTYAQYRPAPCLTPRATPSPSKAPSAAINPDSEDESRTPTPSTPRLKPIKVESPESPSFAPIHTASIDCADKDVSEVPTHRTRTQKAQHPLRPRPKTRSEPASISPIVFRLPSPPRSISPSAPVREEAWVWAPEPEQFPLESEHAREDVSTQTTESKHASPPNKATDAGTDIKDIEPTKPKGSSIYSKTVSRFSWIASVIVASFVWAFVLHVLQEHLASSRSSEGRRWEVTYH